ncbi:MAG: LysE family translocator, partial [Pseudomonadota bacterium]
MSAAFLLTAFVVALVPGTGVVYTVATASFYGVGLGMAAVIGCTLGIVPALLATVLGLATLLHTSALAFVIVKYAGAAYLLYLAWATLRAEVVPVTAESQGSARDGQRSWLGVAWFGFLINILNPKLSAFFLALLPQ